MLANGQKDCRSALRVNADMHAVHIIYNQACVGRSFVGVVASYMYVRTVRIMTYVLYST